MTRTERRWMWAFMGALAAHVVLFHTASLWMSAPRTVKLDLAPGDEPLELTIVSVAPPAKESASALPSPPASVPVPTPETRVEEKPVEKVPEPVKEPDPEPMPAPVLKPVLTEPAPDAPAIVPPAPPAPAPEPQPLPAQPPASTAPPAPSTSAAASSSPSASSSGSAADGIGSPESSPHAGFKGGSAPLSAIKPRYPMGSRIRGEEGPVRIRARVDRRGIPEEVTVLASSGYPALDAAAVRAVKGARFVPPRADAPAESYLSELTIRFQLKDP